MRSTVGCGDFWTSSSRLPGDDDRRSLNAGENASETIHTCFSAAVRSHGHAHPRWSWLTVSLPPRYSACRHSEGHEMATRSEERRVGKEGRSRWAPYH